uniref:Uncharacterized protein n=1 Tax=Arundo donax TaxID=35708 RepID=A0A0A9C127_ARUDO
MTGCSCSLEFAIAVQLLHLNEFGCLLGKTLLKK